MKGSMRKRSWLVQGVVGVVLVAGSKVYADAPKWYDTIAMSGYLQSSYVGNLNAPMSKTNAGRVFDVESNSFNLNAFHLQIAKPVADDNYGFTVKLHTGRDARVIKSAGTGGAGAPDFDVQEAYMTYVVPSWKKLSFIGGKFVTLEGVEVIESPMNPNFSEGMLFGCVEPFTHTGMKANYAFNDKVNTTVGIVNGWDTAADANDGKTVIWQLMTMPTKKVMWSFEGSYGPEALANNFSKRTSLDTVLSVMPMDKLSLWFQGNWGQDTNVTPLAPTTQGTSTVHWNGIGVWAQYAFTSLYTEALRFEVMGDQNGAARMGTSLTFNPGPVINQTVKEITWTHKFQLTKGLATRVEYRHDWSNQPFFGKSDGTLVRNQNTVSADVVVTF